MKRRVEFPLRRYGVGVQWSNPPYVRLPSAVYDGQSLVDIDLEELKGKLGWPRSAKIVGDASDPTFHHLVFQWGDEHYVRSQTNCGIDFAATVSPMFDADEGSLCEVCNER